MKCLRAKNLLLLVALLVCGCQPKSNIFIPPPLTPIDIQDPLPTYDELVLNYNRRVEKLDSLWSAAVVKMEWKDEDGDYHVEQGEGNFIYVRPRDVALTIGKLGETIFWAGSNDNMYWFIDTQDEGIAYVGRHLFVGDPCNRPLPLPVQPQLIPYLFGLMPLDPYLVPLEPSVERVNGYCLIEPPDLDLRMQIDQRTGRLVRVDIYDYNGDSMVTCILSEYEVVEMANLPKPQWPVVATRADIFLIGKQARMTMWLSRISDGRKRNRIKSKAFDIELLLEIHNPQQIIFLDKGCP